MPRRGERPMFRPLAAALTAVVLVPFAAARPQMGEKTGRPAPGEPAPPELRFADGSAVRLALLQDQVEVRTKYGKLTVPLAEIRSVEFGLRVPEETTRRLEAASAGLGSEEFREREQASAELLA